MISTQTGNEHPTLELRILDNSYYLIQIGSHYNDTAFTTGDKSYAEVLFHYLLSGAVRQLHFAISTHAYTLEDVKRERGGMTGKSIPVEKL